MIFNNYPDIVPKEYPLIIFDSKCYVCMANNDKDNNHTSHISRMVHFLRNGEHFKMYKIDWCEGDLKLVYIVNKNVSENDLNHRIKYIMVRLDN